MVRSLVVAHLLSSIGGVTDVVVLQAALLHDTVEDTHTTFEELEEVFGSEVTSVVRDVTDDKSLAKHARKQVLILFFINPLESLCVLRRSTLIVSS